MAPAGSAAGGELKQRKAPRIPVGLALKEHKESKELYWAVVAMQAMPRCQGWGPDGGKVGGVGYYRCDATAVVATQASIAA